MLEVKDMHSLKKTFSTNSYSNSKASKPKIFSFKKIYTHRMEKEKKEKENSIKFLNKKAMRFVVEKDEECNKKKLLGNLDANEGRWTRDEHDKFLDGIIQYGINWKKVKTLINSRTLVQVRSHAQKFFLKLKMCKDEQLGIDFTKDNIFSIRDMIYQIKKINSNYNIKFIFNYLSKKYDGMKKTKKFDFQNYVENMFDNQEILNLNKYDILENGNINLFNNINQKNEMNIQNNIPQSLNINQINTNAFPLNNNILFNNSIYFNNNFLDHQNDLINIYIKAISLLLLLKK